MADGKNTFNLYCDMIGVFEKLTDEKAGQLIKHIFRYVNDQNPETDDIILDLCFEPIKSKLKLDLKRWEAKCLKNAENIKKRWESKDTTVLSGIPNDTNVYQAIPNDTIYTDKDKDKDKEKDKDIINKKHSFKKSPFYDFELFKTKFPDWDILKIKDYYQRAEGYSTANGAKYLDWISAIRNWERNNKDKKQQNNQNLSFRERDELAQKEMWEKTERMLHASKLREFRPREGSYLSEGYRDDVDGQEQGLIGGALGQKM